MNNVTLVLTQSEAQALLALIDIAVKAQGLRVAREATVLFGKLEAAAQPQPEATPEA